LLVDLVAFSLSRIMFVSTGQAALIPCCVECGLIWWPEEDDRFAAYVTDDEPPELAFYCSECAKREFSD